jgi:hypothetical protein
MTPSRLSGAHPEIERNARLTARFRSFTRASSMS